MPGMMLPPGFRFHPTDEELVAYYLKKRVKGIPIDFDVIADVDLYKCEPWDLPSKSLLPGNDLEWFFFSPRDRKYPNGARTNRATEAGYWKATGRDRFVKTGQKTIGMKKTLVFYRGRAPQGERTHWLMHEYRLDGEEWEATTVSQDAYVLCRVFKKDGLDLPKLGRGGMGEEVDNADSPSGEKNPVFFEYDVKPSVELPQQPLSSTTTHQAPPTAISLGQQVLEALPLAPVPVMQPSTGGSFSDFDIDGMSFPKMEGSNYDWLDFAFPEDTPDLIPIPLQDQIPDGRSSEFSKAGWLQEQMYDTPWNTKYEDPLAMQSSMQLATGGDNFEDLDLPPLEDQSPSPPTLPPSSSIEDSGGVVDSPSQPAAIQIRSRQISSFRSPVVRSPPAFSAPHRVRLKKNSRPPRPFAQDAELEASEPEEKMAPGPSESEPDKTGVIADGAQGPDASNAVIEPEIEVENVETQKPFETSPEASTSSVEQASSQLAQPTPACESPLPRPSDDDVKDTEAKETNINEQVVDLDQHPLTKSSVADVDNQKSVTGVFHIKGFGKLPPGIGSIHVNAVTISCSCDKVSSKPHVPSTVCDCYDNSKVANSRALQELRGRIHEEGLEDGQSCEQRRGGLKRSFAGVFFMGAVSACIGYFVSREVWRVTCQILGSSVQIVTAASDL